MNKYVGKYRVVGELYLDNVKNKVMVSESNYIDCNSNIQIYRYDEKTLAIYFQTVGAFLNRLRVIEKTDIPFTIEDYDDGGVIYITEKDLSKVLELKCGKTPFVKPKIKGKYINPKSVKNIPKKYKDNPLSFTG